MIWGAECFAEQIKLYAKQDDLLYVISSLGTAPNILAAVKQVKNPSAELLP